jgi:benzylsuccinate CoA-transferase BbsF subunit
MVAQHGGRQNAPADSIDAVQTPSNRPLEGVRVADFTWVIAGPSLTKNLALLGAEVIRIESSTRAEYRARGGNFALLNDNKKSCALDMSQDEARAIAKRIIAQCDIVVENFGKGVMERFGLDYPSLRALKQDIIMLSCSGLGRTGPDSDKLAFGTLLQLYSGWSMLQGNPSSDQVVIGGAWTDPLTAIHGTFAILAALYHRRRTGEGQYIDLSMVEATLCGLPEATMGYSMNRTLPTRQGNADPVLAPHGCFPCQGHDAWVALSVGDECEWRALCDAIGKPELAGDERFSDMYRRKQHEAELNAIIADWTQTLTPYEAMERLQAAGVPAGPSLSILGLTKDPHLRERGLFVTTTGPDGEEHITIGPTWRFDPPLDIEFTPAPQLGQDSHYVLTELAGLDPAEVERLIEAKVVN